MFDKGIRATESKAMKSEWQDNLVRYLGDPQTVPEVRASANVRIKARQVQRLRWIERSEASGERPRIK
jgi:hypothetical protein